MISWMTAHPWMTFFGWCWAWGCVGNIAVLVRRRS